MAALDRVREEIGYISASDGAPTWRSGLALAGVVLLGLATMFLHQQINRRISETAAL
jgi:hypothetical protein